MSELSENLLFVDKLASAVSLIDIFVRIRSELICVVLLIRFHFVVS